MSFTDDVLDHFKGQIADVHLVTSSGGVFEVKVNGELLHSKKDTGTFPKSDEVIKKMEGLHK
nr:Rdx family protein [Bacillus sp. FJAT-45037]